jgi:hypothetical protein
MASHTLQWVNMYTTDQLVIKRVIVVVVITLQLSNSRSSITPLVVSPYPIRIAVLLSPYLFPLTHPATPPQGPKKAIKALLSPSLFPFLPHNNPSPNCRLAPLP